MTNDRGIVWKDRIKQQAERVAGKVIEKLGVTGAGQKLSPLDKTTIGAGVVEAVIDCMLQLGSFVSAGAQDSIGAKLEQVTIGSKVSLKLIPVEQGNLLELLAANAGKQVTIAFVNQESYSIARDELVKAIHRDQMDWLDDNETPTLFDPQASDDEFCECPAPQFPTNDTARERCGACGKPVAPTGEGEVVLPPLVIEGDAPVPADDDRLRAEAKRLSLEMGLPVSAEAGA